MFGRETRAQARAAPQRYTSSETIQQLPSAAPTITPPIDIVPKREARPTSILGPDISIFGEQLVLKTKGSLLIQGQIEGDVHGESVTVDDGANVRGTIIARTIAIKGGVSGELKGINVILHEHSMVHANILQQKLTVTEGASFEGTVKHANSETDVTPDLD